MNFGCRPINRNIDVPRARRDQSMDHLASEKRAIGRRSVVDAKRAAMFQELDETFLEKGLPSQEIDLKSTKEFIETIEGHPPILGGQFIGSRIIVTPMHTH